MASDLTFVEYVLGQVNEGDDVSFKKMFGEYALYYGDKVVALVCDNQLFVKPTVAGRDYLGQVTEAPPYKGAKPYFLLDDRLDDREWMSALIKVTAEELPAPKPKKPRKAKKS
jgi:DNA transformation protein and related proteins